MGFEMKILRGLENLPTEMPGVALTIGNFDGVHLGHQAVLDHLLLSARQRQLQACVLIFEPSPREFFAKQIDDVPARLSRLREKLLALQACGVDCVIVQPFNAVFSTMTPDGFVTVLRDQLNVKYLTVGEDFRFGFRREGDFAYLKKQGAFSVEATPEFQLLNSRVSSTWVREALRKANIHLAAELLGRPYSMMGRVAHGKKLGRELGFPTANIHVHRAKTPVHGIFAVKVHGIENKVLNGVANIGERPTVNDSRTLLEVYIFNFKKEIYGRLLQIEFVYKLHDEIRYPSIEALKEGIAKDVAEAKAFFGA